MAQNGKNEAFMKNVIISEAELLTLGNISLAMIPGEIFPELVLDHGGYTGEVPPLETIAAQYGIENLLIVGLCNDELGYIVTPEDFCLHETQLYLKNGTDAEGRRHYEETNSTGKYTAKYIAEAFEKLLNGK